MEEHHKGDHQEMLHHVGFAKASCWQPKASFQEVFMWGIGDALQWAAAKIIQLTQELEKHQKPLAKETNMGEMRGHTKG